MKVQWGHPQLRHQIHVGMKICDILSITYCILQTVNPIVTTGEKQRHNCRWHFTFFTVSRLSQTQTHLWPLRSQRSVRFSEIQFERAYCVCSFVCLSACALKGKKRLTYQHQINNIPLLRLYISIRNTFNVIRLWTRCAVVGSAPVSQRRANSNQPTQQTSADCVGRSSLAMRMAQEYDGWAYVTAPLSTLAQLSLFTGVVPLERPCPYVYCVLKRETRNSWHRFSQKNFRCQIRQ